MLGHYGAERWDARTGAVQAPAAAPRRRSRSRAELPGFLDRIGAWQGTWIEDKGGRAVAVHTRRAADPEAAFAALRAPLAELAERHGLMVEPGRLRPGAAPARHGQGRRAVPRTSPRSTRSACSTPATTSGDLAGLRRRGSAASGGYPACSSCSAGAQESPVTARPRRPASPARPASSPCSTPSPPPSPRAEPSTGGRPALSAGQRPQLGQEPLGWRERRGRRGQPLRCARPAPPPAGSAPRRGRRAVAGRRTG